jgi:hypothetical protein
MTNELLMFLLGDGDWIGENSNLLIVTSSSDYGARWAHPNTIYVTVSNILMDLLNTKTKFA